MQQTLWEMRAQYYRIQLHADHILVLQTFYTLWQDSQRIPKTRTLFSTLRQKHSTLSSGDLTKLFGEKPLDTIQKILGIHSKERCD